MDGPPMYLCTCSQVWFGLQPWQASSATGRSLYFLGQAESRHTDVWVNVGTQLQEGSLWPLEQGVRGPGARQLSLSR